MEDFDLGTGINVITITIDNEEYAPRVDLGSVNIPTAIQVFEAVAELLKDMLPMPTVTFEGDIIAAEFVVEFDDEDD